MSVARVSHLMVMAVVFALCLCLLTSEVSARKLRSSHNHHKAKHHHVAKPSPNGNDTFILVYDPLDTNCDIPLTSIPYMSSQCVSAPFYLSPFGSILIELDPDTNYMLITGFSDDACQTQSNQDVQLGSSCFPSVSGGPNLRIFSRPTAQCVLRNFGSCNSQMPCQYQPAVQVYGIPPNICIVSPLPEAPNAPYPYKLTLNGTSYSLNFYQQNDHQCALAAQPELAQSGTINQCNEYCNRIDCTA